MIFDKLVKRVPLFFDGGMGTIFQSMGLTGVPVTQNISNPDTVVDIHKSYIASGADIITANTFGAISLRYENYEEIITTGIKLAKQAIAESGKECLTALDIGPTGKFLKPIGDLDFEECYEIYKRSMLVGEAAGADLIIIETMIDIYEAKAAVLAAKENTKLPVICTMTFDQAGRLITGGTTTIMVAVLEGLGVDVIGINCGLGPVQMKPLQIELNKVKSKPVLVQPNAGLPKIDGDRIVYDITPDEFAEEMRDIYMNGSYLLGGCCGTTPEHIRRTVEMCNESEPHANWSRGGDCKYLACSYSRAVDIRTQLAYGNSINHETNSGVLKASKERDIEFFINAALDEADEEVDVINLNLGDNTYLPEIITGIQEFTAIPLSIQIADDSLEARRILDKALRLYNGKAIIKLGDDINRAAFEDIIQKYGVIPVA